MATGYKSFTAGAVLAAADVKDYLMLQSTMVFASTAARDSALSGVLREGLYAYNTDNNELWFYTGAAWRCVYKPVTTFSPTFSNVTVGNGAISGKYWRDGDTVGASYGLSLGSTSSVTGTVSVTLPVTCDASINYSGSGWIVDSSTGNRYLVTVNVDPNAGGSATPLSTVGNGFVAAGQPMTWAISDTMNFTITYPAA